MIVQCCVCLKVREGNKWVSVPNPYQVMRNASHTYCPKCMKISLKLPQKVRA